MRGRKDATHPQRRASDVWYINSRENWYRDLWLFAVSIVVSVAIFKAVSTSNQASHLAHAIQEQRITQTRENCEDQNARNRDTIETLDRLLVKLPPAERARAKASRQFTVLLIDALAPIRDCAQVVKSIAKLPDP